MTSRKTSKIEEPIALFLVGVQCRSLKSFWKLPFISRKMSKLQNELNMNKDSGLLWGENFISFKPFTTLYLSYWKSIEHINNFANNSKFSHKETWIQYMRKYYKDKNIGIWHETYEIDPNKAENIYVGMSLFGLGAVGQLSEISHSTENFNKRLNK
jgi:hypothetical protein